MNQKQKIRAKVNTRALWDDAMWQNREERWDYVEECEHYVAHYVAEKIGGRVQDITTGYNPAYDCVINNRTYEIKIQSQYMIEIEYAYADGRPSGLSLTEADFHVFVNIPQGRSVGKVRVIPTAHLAEIASSKIQANDIVVREPRDGYGPGSRSVTIDPYNELFGQDGWIGDVRATKLTTEDGLWYYELDFGMLPQRVQAMPEPPQRINLGLGYSNEAHFGW